MTISIGLSSGTAGSSTSQSSWSGTFNLGGVAANDWVVVLVAFENISTSDGSSDDCQLSGEGLTWVKIGEHTNAAGGAGLGCSIAAFKARNTTGSSIGTFDFTATFTSAIVDKCLTPYEIAAGATLDVDGLTSNVTDGSAGYGSLSLSGLDSKQRLYVRACAKRANATSNLTLSSGFTTLFDAIRSRNDAAEAILVRGEMKLATSTGETSNPTHSPVGDTASLFFGLSEPGGGGGGNDVIVVMMDG